MPEHARLAPSSAYRWLSCPGSVELCSSVADGGSEYADEGTAGHAAFAALLTGKPVPKVVGKTEVTPEMLALVEPQVEWVVEYRRRTRAAVHSEQRVEVGAGFGMEPGTFWGTADVVAISVAELCVADLKLGYVDVPVGENEQLVSYALGALDATRWMHDKVRLVILQPRTSDEPKEVVYSAAEVQALRDGWAPRVLEAARGGPLRASEDACRFCPAAGACPELRSFTLALARREMTSLITLSGEEIADLLDKGSMIEGAMKSVRSHALRLLEVDPAAVPGYKRVTGEKKRVWREGAQGVLEKLLREDDIFEKSPRTPAQVEIRLADLMPQKTKKARAEAAREVTAPLAYKPEGEPTLVRESDDRPALGPAFTEEEVRQLTTGEEVD